MTVDCSVFCGKVHFALCGVVSVGCIGEILCCVVLGIVCTISSLTKCDGLNILWSQVYSSDRVSCVFRNGEVNLLLLVLSLNILF